jgi:hypothetical protein
MDAAPRGTLPLTPAMQAPFETLAKPAAENNLPTTPAAPMASAAAGLNAESTRLLHTLTRYHQQAELDAALATVTTLSKEKLELFRHNLRLAKEVMLILNATVKEMEAALSSTSSLASPPSSAN